MTAPPASPPLLSVEDLSVAFGRGRQAVTAVHGARFAIAKGAAFGLIGESGSGKSTVLRAISGLNDRYEGRVTLRGAPLPKPRPKSFFRDVQMVFQDPYGSLHPRKLIRTILLEPVAIHQLDRPEQRLADVLDAVDLPQRFAYRYPHQLSGGQRQRVAIARALILAPSLLLLDEPTSALDVSVQAGILNLLKRLQRELGLTYLMVSHDLAVIAHICSQIAVMTDGRIVEQLSAEDIRQERTKHPYTAELLASSRYA